VIIIAVRPGTSSGIPTWSICRKAGGDERRGFVKIFGMFGNRGTSTLGVEIGWAGRVSVPGLAFVVELALGLELIDDFLVFEQDLADADFLPILIELGEPAGRPAEPIDVVAGRPPAVGRKSAGSASFGLRNVGDFPLGRCMAGGVFGGGCLFEGR